MTPSFESRVLSLAGHGQAARLMPLFASAVNCLKDKEAAMAYGYLMGRSDAENKAPMPKPYIDQQIEDILVNTDVSTDETIQRVFYSIYQWVKQEYIAKENPDEFDDDVLLFLEELFSKYAGGALS